MATLTRETTVILEAGDVEQILTEALCSYGAMGGLCVLNVKQNGEGDFALTLNPKETEA